MKEKKEKQKTNRIILHVAAGLFFLLIFVLALIPNKIYGPTVPEGDVVSGIVFLGDSTIGNCKDTTGIAALVEQGTDLLTYNCAIGGTSMSNMNTLFQNDSNVFFNEFSVTNLVEKIYQWDFRTLLLAAEYLPDKKADLTSVIIHLANVDLKKMNYVFMAQGLNDYMSQVPPFATDEMDVYTYEGALLRTVRMLKEISPNMHIVILTPTYNMFQEKLYDGEEPLVYPLDNYIEVCKMIALEEGVECIDMRAALQIDEENQAEYLDDYVHFNEAGRKLYASVLIDYIRTGR